MGQTSVVDVTWRWMRKMNGRNIIGKTVNGDEKNDMMWN